MKRQWFYRGSLRSCNYSCSYCPFSKERGGQGELIKDRAAWFQFVNFIDSHSDFEGAVQIVPYGEALIHPHYWKGMAVLSKNPKIDAVGGQSNFSFPVEQMICCYLENGGKTDKLRLWGTFHPEMVTVEDFVSQCVSLSEHNISYCAGAVGNPKNLKEFSQLRRSLPESVYVWINKMDGLGRSYTETEKKAFTEIDPYFEMELKHHRADPSKCSGSCFVEADGTMRRCNLCRQSLGNLYSAPHSNHGPETPDSAPHRPEKSDQAPPNTVCSRKECSCYLAYCNQQEESMASFEPYPAFRIPARLC